MRKTTLFISVVLTTFMLAVMFGVVSAYQRIVSSTEIAADQAQPTAASEGFGQPLAPIVPNQMVNVAPEVAAAIASKVLGRTDLYSVEVTQFEGADAYLVTFSSGDLVCLSLDGRVLSISKLPVTVITQAGRGGGGGEDSSGSGSHPEREDHEEHEGGDDD